MLAVEARSSIVTCGLDRGSPTMTKSGGGGGCDSWEREPGIDDDDWDPPGSPQIGRYEPEQPPVARARSNGADGWWTEPPPARRPARPAQVMPALVPPRDPFGGLFNWHDD